MTDSLFDFEISDWETWGAVYCSKEKFAPLIRKIFNNEALEFEQIENCKPGTNGVFRAGRYVIKVFVPAESGYDSFPDYKTELFAMERADASGISVPHVVARGQIQDRYLFRYLIMDFIEGKTLGDIRGSIGSSQKKKIGKELRKIVKKWAMVCPDFNGIDAVGRTLNSKRWEEAPAEIREKQKDFLLKLKTEPFVYVHGDLTEDNLIVGTDGSITVLDFADSLCAPAIYEDMTVICDAFQFDRDFLAGYYGKMDTEALTERCMQAILCHEYGYHVIKSICGLINDSLELRDKIRHKLEGS